MPISATLPCPRCSQPITCDIELQFGGSSKGEGGGLSIDVSASKVTPAPHTCKPQPRGADIEIYEFGDGGPLGVIRPNFVRINGVDVLTPDVPVKVQGLVDSGSDATTVTITMFARSVKVYGVDNAES